MEPGLDAEEKRRFRLSRSSYSAGLRDLDLLLALGGDAPSSATAALAAIAAAAAIRWKEKEALLLEGVGEEEPSRPKGWCCKS